MNFIRRAGVRELTVRAILVSLVAWAAPPAQAQDLESAVEGTYATNLALLTETANAALDELFMSFSAPEGATILVQADADHEANWFVENLLLRRLDVKGFPAYLQEAPQLGPELPRAFVDSTGAPEVPAGEGEENASAPAELVFRYRVAEFGLRYPSTFRKSPLGSRQVQRSASVSVFANLVRGEREEVTWVGHGQSVRMDVVPANKLSLLEGSTFPFTQPTLKSGGLGKLVEPALVTGIVVGLIYLFYTNQN